MITESTEQKHSLRTRLLDGRNVSVSALIHGLFLLLLLGVARRTPTLEPQKLPGTAQGVRLLTYYSPGSPQHTAGQLAVKTSTPPTSSTSSLHAPVPSPAQQSPAAPAADRGTGTTTESGQGEGDLRLALPTHSPHPDPALGSLAHGASGDVILDATIDEQGNIADLKLLQGLGPAIDDVVLSTVRAWTYTPALRNGVPVPSEQELHFHYERS